MKIIQNLILLTAFALVTGCQTLPSYQQPNKEEPHAMLKSDWVGFKALIGNKTHTTIRGVDDLNAPSTAVRLTPGLHKITVTVGSSNQWWIDEIEMNFEAGITYQVQAHNSVRLYTIKVVNFETEEVVFQQELEPQGSGGSTPVFIPIYN